VLARALVEPLHAIEWTEDDDRAAEPPVHPPGTTGEPAIRH
jgi:ATP-dependent Lon protease